MGGDIPIEDGEFSRRAPILRKAALMSLFQCFDEELGDKVGRTVDVL